jgi:hypothetical protein
MSLRAYGAHRVTMMDEQQSWIIVEIAENRQWLRQQAEKLSRCYPGMYEFRIMVHDQSRNYALSLRHCSEN